MMKYVEKVQSTQVKLPYENTKEYYIKLEDIEEKPTYNIVKRVFDFFVSIFYVFRKIRRISIDIQQIF